jgi:TonB-dependent starch-binding outer membrane protein SusC
LGVNANDKWKPLYTIGGSWRISDEAFYKVNFLPHLRFRTTFGYQGNVNNTLSPYTLIFRESASSNFLINQPFTAIATPGNPDLSWETLRQLNIAIDFRTAGDRIAGSFEIYRKKSDDLIHTYLIDVTTGVNSVKKNSAGISTNGIELMLTSININRTFKWFTEFGYTRVGTKVTRYYLNDKQRASVGLVGSSTIITSVKDRSPYAMYSYPFAGLDPATGDPQGYIGKTVTKDYRAIFNQTIDTANLIYHGSAIPTSFGFLNNRFTFKGVSLLFSLSYKFGYYFRKSTISYFDLYRTGTAHPDYLKRWEKQGDENNTTIPSQVYPISNSRRDNFYASSSVNVLKGDNIRLEYIRLGYELNLSRKKYASRNIQVFTSVENIGIIWRANKEDLDPDYDKGNAAFAPPKRAAVGFTLNL